MKPRIAVLLSLFVALAPSAPAFAQDAAKLGELERKVDLLTQEIEKIKLGESSEDALAGAKPGEAPAASKVYRSRPNRVSVGGYGEIVYNNFSRRKQDAAPSGSKSVADALRAVIYLGYKYNDWIVFNSELEVEHGHTDIGRGEVEMEQAYVDFKVSEPLGVRAGMMLVPVGFANELHEPPMFHGVQRPAVERNVIPSTWRENGVGVFGSLGPVTYRSYLMAGLQAVSNTGVGGFTSTSGIRGGRSHGAKSFAEDLASVTRIDYTPVAGALVGGSFYIGQADQDFLAESVPVTLWDVHAKGEYRGAELKALYTEVYVGNADAVNRVQGLATTALTSVGRRMYGGYVEGAFDVLSLVKGNKGHYLAPFARVESYDTQAKVPAAWQKNPANSRIEYTAGVTYKPVPQVSVKADYQWIRNKARTGVNQWNLGLGYLF